MQDIKNEEYITCPRCEKEVYKEAITHRTWATYRPQHRPETESQIQSP